MDNAPPNQILFLTNLPEETNEMMLSMLFNQVDIIINSLLYGSHSYCPFFSSLDSRRSDWCLEGTTLHLLSLKRRCNRQLPGTPSKDSRSLPPLQSRSRSRRNEECCRFCVKYCSFGINVKVMLSECTYVRIEFCWPQEL